MRNKNTAGILAILLGGLGFHKFYLGRGGQGILYLLFSWTLIPAVVAVIEGIIYLTMSNEAFNLKYNREFLTQVAAPQPQNIVVNVSNTAGSTPSPSVGGDPMTSQLRELLALKSEGALTEEEFQTQKQKLLGSG